VTLDPTVQKPEWLVYRAQTGSLHEVYTKNTLADGPKRLAPPSSVNIFAGCYGFNSLPGPNPLLLILQFPLEFFAFTGELLLDGFNFFKFACGG
jgi:hypothetical protein